METHDTISAPPPTLPRTLTTTARDLLLPPSPLSFQLLLPGLGVEGCTREPGGMKTWEGQMV